MNNIFRRPFKYIFCNMTLALVAINFLMFAFTSINPLLKGMLSLNPVCFWNYKMYWQPLTYMFVHANFMHVFFNMLGLVIFGVPTERSIGSKEFVLMYFVCGVFSGIISLIAFTGAHVYVFLMGASGAIYGMLLSYAVIFPRSVIFIWGILPVPAPLLIAIYAVIALFNQVFGVSGGIAHLTHLAGFAVAWLYFIIRMDVHPLKIWKDVFH